jgi:hypothetical protein
MIGLERHVSVSMLSHRVPTDADDCVRDMPPDAAGPEPRSRIATIHRRGAGTQGEYRETR